MSLISIPHEKTRYSFMRGNWNVYIITVGSGIAYWLATGIPSTIQKRASRSLGARIPPFMVGHFFFAVVTVVCCMLNVIKSPSKLSEPRQHIYVGRVGVTASYLSLLFAYVHAWTDPYVPQGLSIGLSIVGVLQLMFTTGGVLYIKQAQRVRRVADALQPHDKEARAAAIEEANQWTKPTRSLLLMFQLHTPPILLDSQERPMNELDLTTACHEEVVARLRTIQHALVFWHTSAMVALFYGACCGPFFFRVPAVLLQLVLPTEAIPDEVMFLGLVPSILLPEAAARAIKENKWY